MAVDRPLARRLGSGACLVLGTVALLLGVAMAFLETNVFERDGFSANAVEAVRDDAAAEWLGTRLAEQLVVAYPDLVAGQAPLTSLLPQVVASSAFEPIVATSAGELHDALFRRERGSLVLDLADAGIVIDAFLRTRAPDVAERLPSDLQSAFVTIAERDWAVRLIDAAERVRLLAWVLPFASIVLLGASLLLAESRRRAAFRIGVGAAIAGVVLWIGFLVAGSLVLREVQDEDTLPAAEALLAAILGNVWVWALVLGLTGVALAAAAASLLEGLDGRALARRAWAAAIVPPAQPALRILWIAVVGIAGIAFVVGSSYAIRAVFALAGFFLLVEALSEAIRMAGPGEREVMAPGARALAGNARRRTVAAVLATVAVAGGVAALVVVLVGGGDASVKPVAAVASCNGSAELCERRLDEVVFPGAHNAMSSAVRGFTNPNQTWTLTRMLDRGIRAFLLDVHEGQPASRGNVVYTELRGKPLEIATETLGADGIAAAQRLARRAGGAPTGDFQPYLCHIICELGGIPLVDGLTEIRTWLDAHPGEVVIIVIEDYVPPGQIELAFAESGLLALTYAHEPGAPWPTLRELADAGQRVVVMAENEGLGPGTWYQAGYEELLEETPYDSESQAALRSDESCEPNRGGTGKPLFLLNHWAATYPPRPSEMAAVNERAFLLDRVERCEAIRGRTPTILALDFVELGDLLAVTDELNQVAGSS